MSNSRNSSVAVVDSNQTANSQNPNSNSNPPQNTFTKKLGQTTYKIQIYFSETSKDDFSDKLLRLIKNGIASGVKGA